MKKLIINLCLLLCWSQVLGQGEYWDEYWDWCRSFGDRGADVINCAVSDNYGNTYIAGHFYKKITFDEFQLNSNGDYDAFIAKIDIHGNVSWAKNFGGSHNENLVVTDYAKELFLDKDGNIYLVGNCHSCSHIDSIRILNTGSSDIFITKIDPRGVVLWAKSFGNETHEILTDAYLYDDNILLCGNQIIIDIENKFQQVSFFVSLNSSGDINWTNTINQIHKFAKISVLNKQVCINLLLANSGKFKDAAMLNYELVYDFKGNFISSSPAKELHKIKENESFNVVPFYNDTVMLDTKLFMDGKWINTALINEKNNIDIVVPGKVVKIVNNLDHNIIIGNHINSELAHLNTESGFIDFFIGKTLLSHNINNGNVYYEFSEDVHVFPNPSESQFKIVSNIENQGIDIYVFNSLGVLISKHYSISLPYNLIIEEKGYYTLKIVIQNNISYKKVVKI